MVVRKHCYLFCLIPLLLFTLASPTLYHRRHDQRGALLELKDEFPILRHNSSANHTWLSSWKKESDCCSWERVTCDTKSGQVISLDLHSISLNNSLKSTSALFKLQYLQDLSLYKCNLYGEIPSSLGNRSRLTNLNLVYNHLQDQVPASIGNLTQLKYLILAQNNFSGTIPLSFANLTKLILFNLENNYLESTLPPNMSGFQDLEYFSVGANSFVGPFPKSLFTIPSLEVVDLEGNQFKGHVEFGNTSSSLSRLRSLYLSHNQFNGLIPESISHFLNLKVLHLGYNNFTGPIPISISKLVKLEHLGLSNNNLEGQVPGCLRRLTTLDLSHNAFKSFENSWEAFSDSKIRELELNSNSFQGPFPQWICKLRSVLLLELSNNLFNGSIPPCIRNSTNFLQVLILRNNSLSGILPDIFTNATKLLSLDISRNQLEGKLPRSLINCKAMKFLNVESNKIKDEFPSWLGSLASLNILILRSNQFFGTLYHRNVTIGFQRLRVIDLSHNDFIGTLPPFYWREMTTLTGEDDEIEFYDNNPYMDQVLNSTTLYINSMEMVHKGVKLEFERINRDYKAIDFSGNRFSGNIPESIGFLKKLRLLNLSSNAFTGNISPSLANLTNLEALDISRNKLSGYIPEELGKLSSLSYMNFSNNLLEGTIPRGTQFQRQECSSFLDNLKLYGLEEICGENHVPNPTPQQTDDFSEPEEQVINWIAAAIAYGPGVFCGLVIGHIFASHKHEWFMEKFGRSKPRAANRSTH